MKFINTRINVNSENEYFINILHSNIAGKPPTHTTRSGTIIRRAAAAVETQSPNRQYTLCSILKSRRYNQRL